MTTNTATATATGSKALPIALAALLGLCLIIGIGHVQSQTLHNAAHDVRHANGFPCH